jgi:hypothetical protein
MPTSLNAVLIIALLIAPGYLTLGMIRRRHQLTPIKSEVEFVVATITAGVLVQGIAYLWPGRRVISDYADGVIDHTGLLVAYLIAVLCILPLICGVGASWILRQFSHRLAIAGMDEIARTSYAWMFIGNRKEGSYVRIWLKSNPSRAIAGKLSTESFVSMEEDQPDLYLEEDWDLDENDWFRSPSPHSAGMWVSRKAIDHIEFKSQTPSQNSPSRPSDDRGSRPSVPVKNPPPPPPQATPKKHRAASYSR